MAIAAVVSGDAISIAHVGKDRAYLVRDGQIRQLTLDHSMLEEYRREHPDAAQADLDRLPRKDVLTRALGRRDSVEVDVLTERVRDGDRILLASEALHRTLEEQTILEAVREHGLEKADLEEAVQGVWDRAARRGGPQVTVILLGFVMKQR
jgi:serine/threonine protein phosphatase PrpC